MKVHKRKKSHHMHGIRTRGWGAKKHKGKGNQGGKGMSGTGKRADQRKSWVIKYRFPYFGKKGFTSKKTQRDKRKSVNLRDIFSKYPEQKEIKLEDSKILGGGKGFKATIIAKEASKSAVKKMEDAGGKIIKK